MASPPLLLLQDVRLTLGGTAPLLDGAELAVGAGERICLVGRNGSGKSTLLKVAAGLLRADAGTRFLQPGTTVRYLPQEPDLSGFPDVRSYVAAGLGPEDGLHRGQSLLDQLGLTGDEPPAALSGGQARRAALARTLAPAPDLLLLDEPTNHLDLPAIEWLEAELASLRSGLVLISHDRRLLERVGRSVVWLDDGRTRRMDRGFAHFEAWRNEVEEEAERERHKLDRQIVREEHWLRYGITARRKRNVRRLANLETLRRERREGRNAPGTLRLQPGDAEVSGKLVAVAEDATRAYPGHPPLVRDLTLRVLRGDRLGIVGPNGAGKTTLLRLLTGQDPPDTGEVRVGTALETVVLDQNRAVLDPGRTVTDTLTGGSGDQVDVRGTKQHVVGYMKEFLFRPEQARTPVGHLSGGERGRLVLALALARPSNLLVLDEPTNDLDLETLDLLQEMLGDYPGTVVVVSHDRDFLDRVVTSTLAAEGSGRWVEYAGGYSDMLRQRGEPPPPARSPLKTSPLKTPAPKPPAQPRPGRPASRRLSFTEKRALETLPARLDVLAAAIAAHQQALSDPELYRRDPGAFARRSAALATSQDELADAEEEWLRLEMLREELEGAAS